MPGVSWHNEKSETSKAGCAFSAILVKSPIWFQLFQLSKLKTFMMENAIDFNIILSLRFVKGFVPACCPVCTRRKRFASTFVSLYVCQYVYGKCTNYRLHLHILLLLRGGKSTCTPNGVAPSCSMTILTTPECTDDSTPCIDTNAPHESDAQENINIILYDMSITQSFTRTTNESAKRPDHTTTDRHNGRQIAELRWYFNYASPK